MAYVIALMKVEIIENSTVSELYLMLVLNFKIHLLK